MNCCFDFPEDREKIPALEINSAATEKIYYELLADSMMKTTEEKIFRVATAVLCMMFFFYVTALAFFSGAFAAAAIYGVITALIALIPAFVKALAKKNALLYPNYLEIKLRFYKHHFTAQSEYSAEYVAYDEIKRAAETSFAFLIYSARRAPIAVSKAEMSKEQTEKLRTIFKVKLGSKFRVKVI